MAQEKKEAGPGEISQASKPGLNSTEASQILEFFERVPVTGAQECNVIQSLRNKLAAIRAENIQ